MERVHDNPVEEPSVVSSAGRPERYGPGRNDGHGARQAPGCGRWRRRWWQQAADRGRIQPVGAGDHARRGGHICPALPGWGWSTVTATRKGPVFYPASCAATQDGGQVCVAAGYYYVQRDAEWQAPCPVGPLVTVPVRGACGDNLAGDAKLKVGSPIRVEMVLWDARVPPSESRATK